MRLRNRPPVDIAGGCVAADEIVDARLRATFGERYALRIQSEAGTGTTVTMTVPRLVGEEELRPSPVGVAD